MAGLPKAPKGPQRPPQHGQGMGSVPPQLALVSICSPAHREGLQGLPNTALHTQYGSSWGEQLLGCTTNSCQGLGESQEGPPSLLFCKLSPSPAPSAAPLVISSLHPSLHTSNAFQTFLDEVWSIPSWRIPVLGSIQGRQHEVYTRILS